MGRYRNYSTDFKRQLAEEWLSGKTTLSELARRHNIERGLILLRAKNE
jgi:transposase-like protein